MLSFSTISLLLIVNQLASTVNAHGFLWSVGRIGQTHPNVRGIQKMNTQIDALRNPLSSPNTCRGEPATLTRTPLVLSDNLTLTFAISRVAAHVGPCQVEINGVLIASAENCIAHRAVGCPAVPGSTTNDMCLQEFTFDVTDKNVSCQAGARCVLRWMWKAEHISVSNPEKYENCIDIELSGGSGGLASVVIDAPPAQIGSRHKVVHMAHQVCANESV